MPEPFLRRGRSSTPSDELEEPESPERFTASGFDGRRTRPGASGATSELPLGDEGAGDGVAAAEPLVAGVQLVAGAEAFSRSATPACAGESPSPGSEPLRPMRFFLNDCTRFDEVSDGLRRTKSLSDDDSRKRIVRTMVRICAARL